MPDVSPTRWHLAHTAWFFETFLLKPLASGYSVFNAAFEPLFNSYYNGVGQPFPRARRGLLSRPTVGEVFAYRRYVDEHVTRLLSSGARERRSDDLRVLELGLQHEQQHQELILTDIQHVFAQSPLFPAYRPAVVEVEGAQRPLKWVAYDGGVVEVGCGESGFAFDNERPRHEVLLPPFELADRLVTNGEYLTFMNEGGYERPELWLADGWELVRQESWRAPLYWRRGYGLWRTFSLAGMREIESAAPVCHVSYFEADAYARFANARLPLEAEWETAARQVPIEGNFVENRALRPLPVDLARVPSGRPGQLFGDAWEWTASPYVAYPGYRPFPGTLGEYNGKFMCNQFVLRGGSCVSPRDHLRATYRNFFPPAARWQFSGIRLARSRS
jgi:ergothioneine biosynthesis protein EgtB